MYACILKAIVFPWQVNLALAAVLDVPVNPAKEYQYTIFSIPQCKNMEVSVTIYYPSR